jgi:hypothetical protein
MTWNLVQSTSGLIASGTPLASPETFAFLNPNQSGNLLVLQVQCQTLGGAFGAPVITGATDTNSNSYRAPPGVINQDFSNGYTSTVYYAHNSVAGANSVNLAFDVGVGYVTGANQSGTASSFSASVTPTAVGQIILVWCATLNGSATTMTVSDNQGNTYTNAITFSTSSGSIYLWWAVASTTAATTYTVQTLVGGVSTAVAAASFAAVYSGISTNNPIDIFQGAPVVSVGTSAAPAGGSITPSFNGEWLISGLIPAGGTITDPSGYTNRQASSTVVAQSSDSNTPVAPGVAQTPTWALSSSNAWLAFNLLLVPQGPPVTDIFWFLSEWENSGGATTVDPFDSAIWSMQTFGSTSVAPQILLPVSAANDLILMHAFVNNSSGVLGQIGGINATQLAAVEGSTISQYVTAGAPLSTPGFAPGIVPCTLGQSERQWTGTAIAFRYGGNPNTSPQPVCINNGSTPIINVQVVNVRLSLPCTAGDLLVVSINSGFAISSITDSAGNVYQQASGSAPNYIWYAYNINAYAAGNVVTVAFTGVSGCYVDVLEYTGIISSSNPLDQAAFTPPTTGPSGFTPTVTTLFPNELVLSTWTTGAPMWPQLAGGSTTWNYLYNVRDSASNAAQIEVDLVLGSPGAIVSTGQIDGGGPWGCGIATFRSKALFISTQPSNQTVGVGNTATFSVVATAAAGSLTYQWQLNGSNIGGATSSSYTTPTLGVGTGGTYTCVVTDFYGSTTSWPAQLYVTANPGGGIGIPTLGQVSNGEIPANTSTPTSNVIYDSMNF